MVFRHSYRMVPAACSARCFATTLAVALAGWVVASMPIAAQAPPEHRPAGQHTAASDPPAAEAAGTPSVDEQRRALVQRVPDAQFATLRFSNRAIVTFRATIVPRDPAERVDGALRALNRLADDGVTGPVSVRPVLGAAVITVAGRDVFALVRADVDDATDEDLPHLTSDVTSRVDVALREAAEARTPSRLARAAGWSLLATFLVVTGLVALVRLRRLAQRRVVSFTEARIARSRVGQDEQLMRATRLFEVVRGVLRLVALALAAGAIYMWLAFVLQQFPVTRPWGEALGGFLATTVKDLAWNALTAMPGLFTAAVIFVITRFLVRLTGAFFEAVEHGRVQIAALNGYKAVPTRRVVTTLMWLFGVVVAYPYLPGSNTEAFKGVSVFVGLVVSLGSSGIVNQLMSGFMLTYSGALAPGEYVRVGDVEGTVSMLGVLSTKITTPRNEEVTIPNAVVISGTTVNYTRHAAQGVFAVSVVTIGYDTPWRQVEAMLLLAAERTAGVRATPAARVLQTNLADFYVEYSLLVCLDSPWLRVPTLAALHANIQDAFNEHGVQIMSPHYETDPKQDKVVPPERWYPAPAKPPQGGSGSAT
jgi:small-conductance mechanosensitive channel